MSTESPRRGSIKALWFKLQHQGLTVPKMQRLASYWAWEARVTYQAAHEPWKADPELYERMMDLAKVNQEKAGHFYMLARVMVRVTE